MDDEHALLKGIARRTLISMAKSAGLPHQLAEVLARKAMKDYEYSLAEELRQPHAANKED